MALTAIMTNESAAQLTYYRVTFIDKGPGVFEPGSQAYEAALAEYHPRSLARRAHVGMDPLLGPEDRPVHQPYVDELTALNINDPILLRWRNAMVFATDTITASQIGNLTSVKSIVRTNIVSYDLFGQPDDCSPARPGLSSTQHDALNTLTMIDAGVSGKGATIALLDNGFRTQELSSLQHADIQGSFDAIYGDDDVSNGPNDPPDQDGHGTLIFSIVGGWEQDSLIGTAPFASYLLVKTEDMRFERRVEEDFYCAGVEWAERNGADVISSSLGYYGFDSTEAPMLYDWLDGNTTFASRAVNMAAMRGVICVTASGNSGPEDSTLIIPADADSVVAVGAAIGPAGMAWPFSGRGPTADGRDKPDLAAVGVRVRSQGLGGTYIRASGTSMSTPQIAGLFGLVRQLYDDLPAWEIKRAVLESGRNAPEDGRLGAGLPDAVQAARLLGQQFGPGIGPPVVVESQGQQRVLAALFSSDYPEVQLQLRGVEGALNADLIDTLWYGVDLTPGDFDSDTIYGRLVATVDGKQRSYPSDTTWFPIPRRGSHVPCGVRLPGSIVSVSEAPSPRPSPTVYPNPMERGKSTLTLVHLNNVHTIRLVSTSSGTLADVDWSAKPDGRLFVRLPDLAQGHYVIVVEHGKQRTALPLIIH